MWTPETAEVLAREAGVDPLTDLHWKVIALCREEAARSGRPPDLRSLCDLSGLDGAALRRLFPDKPHRLAARIAGLPAPTDSESEEDER
jgi:tRNA 2-thiouridine synthesizing protein E